MMWLKEFGEEMLSYYYEKEEWQGEQNAGYRDPCHPETDQQVYKLEECKYGYVFEWHRLHKGSMTTFQDPANMITTKLVNMSGK